MKIRNLVVILVFAMAIFACNDDPAAKVKKENVELAKKRDKDLKYNSPEMKFEETEHDFGDIKQGEMVEKVFKFKNTGKRDLIIYKAKASCGCTVPTWPKEPIKPGEEGKIVVKFNSRGRKGAQNKQVTLTTNTAKGKELLHIKGMVVKQ